MEVIKTLDAKRVLEVLSAGGVMIYPTDTIYGLGCDATNKSAVEKIRLLKKRDVKPFSVIAPSKKWILENAECRREWLDVLPGPYTLVVNLRKICVAGNVNSGLGTLGVRIPDSGIKEIVKTFGKPVVTTSVNLSGEKFMSDIKDIPKEFYSKVNLLVYIGSKKGKPSTVYDYTKGSLEIVSR